MNMGIMSQLLGADQGNSVEDYTEIDLGELAEPGETSTQLHIAELDGQASAMEVKDAYNNGDVVVADISRLNTEGGQQHIIDDLDRLARETGGDIVQNGDYQLIMTPPGMNVSREKLTA